MKKSILLASVALSVFACKSPQLETSKTTTSNQPVDPTIYGKTITSTELKDMLFTYASDEFAGRETGEPGQKLAVEYLKKHYVNLGIPSPIAKGDYFQEVPLEKQKSPKIEMDVNGNTFKNFEDFVMYGGTKTQQITVNDIVYAGYGIDSDNYSDYKNLDVKDKIVLIKSGEPKNADGTYVTSNTTEATKWSSGRQALSSKRDAAKSKGAKALFIMDNEMFPRYAAYFAAQAKSGHSGRISLKSNKPEMMLFLINENLGKALHQNINTNDKAKTVKSLVNLDIKAETSKVDSENVLAYIKGTEKPDEVIVISAHLDHEGVKDGKVYNGADDDGSGSVAILEIAEAFKAAADKGHGPKRSILFLHVTGEEKGLLGSKYYTDQDPVFPLENTVVNLNIDMIGRVDEKHKDNRNFVYLIGSDKLSQDLHQLSENVNKTYSNIDLDYTYNDENDPNRYYYRSDHYNFAKNDIPVIFYFNGTHEDYHKPTDIPEKIQYDLLENRARLVFYTAWEIANRDARIALDKKTVTASE